MNLIKSQITKIICASRLTRLTRKYFLLIPISRLWNVSVSSLTSVRMTESFCVSLWVIFQPNFFTKPVNATGTLTCCQKSTAKEQIFLKIGILLPARIILAYQNRWNTFQRILLVPASWPLVRLLYFFP